MTTRSEIVSVISFIRWKFGIEQRSIRCEFLVQVSDRSFLSVCHPYNFFLFRSGTDLISLIILFLCFFLLGWPLYKKLLT